MRRLCLLVWLCFSTLVGKEASLKREYATSCQEFTFSLYERLKEPEKNLLFSPYSIFTCISMAYAGANGKTATEIEKALSITTERGYFFQIAETTNNELLKKVHIANGFWADRDTFFLSAFRHLIEKNYQAQVESLDFQNRERSTSIINEWTRNQTKGKIETILAPDDINTSTRLVLTNAIYFQDNWKQPFDPKLNREVLFKKSSSKSVFIPMMHMTQDCSYYEDELLQLILLPLQEKNMAALFFLPKTDSFLDKLVNQTALNSYLDQIENKSIAITLPKFSLKQRFYLKETLISLGMKEAFSDHANFSLANGMRDLFIDRVVHEALFTIDERGLLAAGSTASSLGLTSVPEQSSSTSFLADHPFIFMLVDLENRIPLFIGKVHNPS